MMHQPYHGQRLDNQPSHVLSWLLVVLLLVLVLPQPKSKQIMKYECFAFNLMNPKEQAKHEQTNFIYYVKWVGFI
jgi:hypothetical protein